MWELGGTWADRFCGTRRRSDEGPGDAESKWPRPILIDRRVEQRWDEPKTAGRWFLTHLSDSRPSRGGARTLPRPAEAPWDSYVLFDRGATWSNTPSGLLSWGSTVIKTRDKLVEDFRYAVARR